MTDSLPVPSSRHQPGNLVAETVLVLGVGLGASALYSVLAIVDRLTVGQPLNDQTAAMNTSVAPDRPWLDLSYQLVRILLALVPALLALFLLRRDDPDAARRMGFDLRRPGTNLIRGALLAAAIGLPGIALYAAARALGLNATVAPANLADVWWAVPVLVLAAIENAVLEEVTMIGYLFTRWSQAGWSLPRIMVTSALVRGTYHLYQGFGGFLGNLVMGLVFGLVYNKTRRVAPLVVAHTLLDIVAFVGYALLRGRVGWL
ncbi:MAG: CPBP family intramembrane glutamic endopeptidase [Nostocoides sp.]